MSAELMKARNKRLERINECMVLTKTTKKDFVSLGFSEEQVRGWFAKSGSSKARSPTAEQMFLFWGEFDWSPTYLVFGAGSRLISEAGLMGNLYERMNRFEGVLQLALDEAEVNKQRYRGALKAIEDRNQQIVMNKETLKAADLLMKECNKNMLLLSNQLAHLLTKGEDMPISKQ